MGGESEEMADALAKRATVWARATAHDCTPNGLFGKECVYDVYANADITKERLDRGRIGASRRSRGATPGQEMKCA